MKRSNIYSISEEENECERERKRISNTNNYFALEHYNELNTDTDTDTNMNTPMDASKATNERQRYRRRMLRKCGACNLRKIHLPCKRKNLSIQLQDLFSSLVEGRWRYIFLTFIIINVISWYLIGILWWIVAYHHGDLKTHSVNDADGYNDTEPCIYGMYDFASSILFSIEVQSTLGFGYRYPSTKCPEAMFILVMQILFGTLLTCVMCGIVFTKVARPMARTKAIVFSKKAVICMRDNTLCFLFRVADVRKSKILGANVKAYCLYDHTTVEGEIIPRYQRKLDVSVDEAGSDVMLFGPLTVCHKIRPDSPLFNLDALDLLRSDFEIIVSLCGVVETTGQTLEARTSYVPSEILWGHRFAPVITKLPGKGDYVVNYRNFDDFQPLDTPICSARQISDYSDPNSPANFFFGAHFDSQRE